MFALPQLSPARVVARVAHAGAKALRARLRERGVGKIHPDWQRRAELCERCPLRTTIGKTSYCGRPFLDDVFRDEPTDGCGCPTRLKARDPAEHCVRTARFGVPAKGACDCVWCST